MSNIQYNHIQTDEGQEFLTVLIDGTLMPPIDDSHPNFGKIKEIVIDPEAHGVYGTHEGLVDLFDVSATISKKFESLSERVTIRGGTLFFDGDPIDGTVVETVLRFVDEGIDGWEPLVNYIENIQNNPEQHSKEQLFDWLRHHQTISLNEDGFIVAYKGVENGGTHPETGNACWQSTHAGRAIVDDVEITGKIPNYVGATVEMPRSEVMHDPQASCHAGLHVGTFDYARAYGRDGVMLAVLVNPRDVVSVPYDARGEKIRVARYKVLDVVTEPFTGVLVPTEVAAPEPIVSDEPVVDEFPEVDLTFGGEETEAVEIKVGDFVRGDYSFEHTEDDYIGTVTEIRSGPDYAKVKVERPKDDVRGWFLSTLADLTVIRDPRLPQVGDVVTGYDWGSNRFEGTVISLPGETADTPIKQDWLVDTKNRYVIARPATHPLAKDYPYFVWPSTKEHRLTIERRASTPLDEAPWYVGKVVVDRDGDKVVITGDPTATHLPVRYVSENYSHVSAIHLGAIEAGYLTVA